MNSRKQFVVMKSKGETENIPPENEETICPEGDLQESSKESCPQQFSASLSKSPLNKIGKVHHVEGSTVSGCSPPNYLMEAFYKIKSKKYESAENIMTSRKNAPRRQMAQIENIPGVLSRAAEMKKYKSPESRQSPFQEWEGIKSQKDIPICSVSPITKQHQRESPEHENELPGKVGSPEASLLPTNERSSKKYIKKWLQTEPLHPKISENSDGMYRYPPSYTHSQFLTALQQEAVEIHSSEEKYPSVLLGQSGARHLLYPEKDEGETMKLFPEKQDRTVQFTSPNIMPIAELRPSSQLRPDEQTIHKLCETERDQGSVDEFEKGRKCKDDSEKLYIVEGIATHSGEKALVFLSRQPSPQSSSSSSDTLTPDSD